MPFWEGMYSHQTVAPSPPGGSGSAFSIEAKALYALNVRAPLPVVTFVGWWGGRLLGGLVIMEIIFVVPGMGTALVQAVSQRDYPTVQAIVFVMAVVFLVVNLLVDLSYTFLNPRVAYD